MRKTKADLEADLAAAMARVRELEDQVSALIHVLSTPVGPPLPTVAPYPWQQPYVFPEPPKPFPWWETTIYCAKNP